MIIRNCLYLLTVMFVSLGFVNAAQANRPVNIGTPIIARVGRSIYAVSADTGESNMLDEVSTELSQVLKKNYSGVGISLEDVSPDNTYLAYTAGLSDILDSTYSEQVKPLAQRNPNDVYIVNIATGERINVTNQSARFADEVSSGVVRNYSKLKWSQDGSRLYFVAELRSLNDHPLSRTLHAYNLETAEDQRVADLLPSPLTADNLLIGLYPVKGGVASVTALDHNGNMRFTLFGENNKVTYTFVFKLKGSQDVNAWMFDYNPIHISDRYKFGYFSFPANSLQPNVLDLLNGESQAVSADFKVNTVSRKVPESSLRIVLNSVLVGDIPWVIADSNGKQLITLDNELFISDSAIAPDGQSIAYLGARKKIGEPRDIFVFDGKESHALGFAADEILWGSVEYIFVPLN
ncbi:MAG: hypothetical protein GC179_00625 [Anaerolineaceae bacterium]|nr:hypothetical protein [Anaerolineaceae bacterium]